MKQRLSVRQVTDSNHGSGTGSRSGGGIGSDDNNSDNNNKNNNNNNNNNKAATTATTVVVVMTACFMSAVVCSVDRWLLLPFDIVC